jgi:hypothetical protein
LNRSFHAEETPHTTHMNKLKKSQPLRIIHPGCGIASLAITIYATVGTYDRVLDYYAAKCVEHIISNQLFDQTIEHHNCRLMVTLA